jgi:uncharacterized membrane protein
LHEHETPAPHRGESAPQPSQGPSNASASHGARTFEPSKDERVIAALAHGLTFLEGGIIGPLVIYLVKKDESDFVAFHALQSLYFGALFFLVSFLTCGLAALVLVWPYLLYEGLATFRAYEGDDYELPIAGAWARKSLPRREPSAPAVF